MINIDIERIRELDKLPRKERVLQAALDYAKMGLKVIPQIGKAPQVKEVDASSDPMTIRRWFGPGGAFEGQNLGLVLSDCRVLDLDRHDGKDGVKAIGVPLDQIACPREATPGNGYHLLVANTDLKGRPNQGIDIKTRITTWPSEVEGVQYRWETGGEPGRLTGAVLMRAGGKDTRGGGTDDTFSPKFNPLAPSAYINFHLEYVDADTDYDTWLKIGMAIHSNDTGPESMQIWEDWSRQGSKFKEGECEKKWATFNSSDRSKPITIRWLIAEAKKNGAPVHQHDDIYYQSAGATVAELNETYGFYNAKGAPYIVSTNERGEACFSTMSGFEMILANRPVISNGKPVSAAVVWLKSPQRRIVTQIGMWPHGKEPEGALNTWTGLAIPAVKCEESEIQEFLDFCVEDICRGNKKYAEYLWDMMAAKIQNPLRLLGIALVISGGEGTGKGLITGVLGQIIGPNHSRSVSSRGWLEKFGGDLISSAVYVEAHEASWSGNHTEAGRLKAMMTEKKLDWEGKNKPAWSSPNYMFIAITTNDDWAVPAGADSRRFFVLRTSSHRQNDDDYWVHLAELIGVDRESGEPINPEYLGKIRYWLENREIKGSFARALETEHLTRQRKETAIDSREDLLVHWVRATFCVENAFGFNRPGGVAIPKIQIEDDYGQYIRTSNLAQDYREFCGKGGRRRAAFPDETLFNMLGSLGMTTKKVRKHKVSEGGNRLSDAPTDSKVSVMFIPDPETIEQNIAKMFELFAESQNDEDDSNR